MRFFRALWSFEYGLAAIGAGFCLAAIVLVTVASVFGRYVLGTDLVPGGYNYIERVLFPLLVFWALPVAYREGVFPKFELLSDSLPRRLRRGVGFVVLFVEFCVYLAVLWFSLNFVMQAVETGRSMQIGTDMLPLWPVIVMIPLAFGLMVVEMARLLVVVLRRLSGGAE